MEGAGNGCLRCGRPWGPDVVARTHWARICEACRDRPEPPREITIAEELAGALGEGPGPDDDPAIYYPDTVKDAAERLARVRRYADDIQAGRPITFVPSGRRLA